MRCWIGPYFYIALAVLYAECRMRFEGLDLHGRAVLLRTGWDRYWGTDEYGSGRHPFLDKAGAMALVAAGA